MERKRKHSSTADSGAPGRNRTDVYALIWRVLSPGYKAGALTNMSNRGAIDRFDHAGIRWSSELMQVMAPAYRECERRG